MSWHPHPSQDNPNNHRPIANHGKRKDQGSIRQKQKQSALHLHGTVIKQTRNAPPRPLQALIGEEQMPRSLISTSSTGDTGTEDAVQRWSGGYCHLIGLNGCSALNE
jgi:hypothetical protein